MKTCTKCQITQPASNFSPDRRVKKDGLQAQCKPCRTQAMKQWRTAHPEAVKEIARRSYKRNSEAVKERAREYYYAHTEMYRANGKAWAAENKERIREYHRVYRTLNPEKVRIKERNHKHSRRTNSAASEVTPQKWQNRLAEFGHRCAYCLSSVVLEMEHIDPVSRGGAHLMSNLVPACGPCNRSKGNRPLLVHLLRKKGRS